MYEIRATLPTEKGLDDLVLDELVALFESHQQDCTCAVVRGAVLGYVEEDMLSPVTALLLKHAPKVEVQAVTEDEAMAVS
jgi:hypothetical protein